MKQPNRFITCLLLLFICFSLSGKEDDMLYLSGRVKDAVLGTELTSAVVVRYDAAGNRIDSIKADRGRTYKNGEVIELARFGFMVERKDSTYVFDVECPGYITQTVTYRVENVGKREDRREIPIVFLQKAPHKLNEVTVTASKIKFYHKGDTLVYNASAFQLSDGSMLDALISQLPGAELNEEGQIKINGEFVESLLLNGKKFFDGNNQLMLENIAAYTVKSVEVYRGQTHEEKWLNDPTKEKHLTMDVRLKKEYNLGAIINAQGGYGTEGRYMGRLFASWFTPLSRYSLIGNFNNLNDNRKPGKSDTWTPEMMPSGTKRYKMAAFNYDHSNRDDSRKLEGYVNFEETSNNNYNTVARTNFLSGGNTYDNSFSHSKSSNLKLETRNYQTLEWKKFYFWNVMTGRYIRRSSMSDVISATFNKEQAGVTRQMLEALYSDGSPEVLEAVINRSVTRSDGHGREWEVQCFPTLNYKIPRTNDIVRFQLGVKYKDAKEELWRDYNINYGADPVAAVTKRQYFDNSPNRRLTLDGTVEYGTTVGKMRLNVYYSYRFENTDKDSYMYALDRLADMGIYGTVPSGYLAVMDPSNSYTSRLMTNRHSVKPILSWFPKIWPKTELFIQLHPEISLQHDHLDYWRDGRDYLVTRSSVVAVATRYDASAIFSWGAISKGRRLTYANELRYSFNYNTKTPDLLHMVDVVNDADPLNIAVGNPDLRNEYIRTHNIEWIYRPDGRTLSNTLSGSASFTTDALVRGYTYDTTTGVRHTSTYNVDGNSSYSVNDSFMLQFGRRQQFTMSANAGGSITNYADMIGVDRAVPEQSKVTNHVASGNLKLDWQIGRQNVQLSGGGMLRHTISSREDFNTINARHFNYGVLGQFVLPCGFGINTDFMFYTRRGYGLSYLDTTDAIWNVRVTYTPRGGRWVFMADGFDLLHQLSNVNYAVNASGRTISYSNALPRYVLFSVQYRLNIMPKKR